MPPRRRSVSAAQITAALEEFGRTRDLCVSLITDLPIHGPHAQAVHQVMAAIDGFAEVATGDRTHFLSPPCSPPGWSGTS